MIGTFSRAAGLPSSGRPCRQIARAGRGRSGRWAQAAAGLAALAALAGCGRENQYVEPPPPKVTVAPPVQQQFTPYLESTGNAASIASVDLVARVQGFLQEIKYQDGTAVAANAPLFVIEPEPYQVKLQQAQAAEAGSKATLANAESEYNRQLALQAKDVSTQANLDKALASRDSARADVQQAQANTEMAQINLGYTQVNAPFAGVVSRHLVSVGELVGVSSPTQLATIVQLDPIYVYFNISESDVQRVRADLAARGINAAELIDKVPVEVGLQTETGYPHRGVLDYASPTVDQSTGTLTVRGKFDNAARSLLPGYYVRVRVPLGSRPALLVPEIAVGADQGGRYVLVVNADNIVEQRRVQLGQSSGALRVVNDGLKPDDRVVVAGLMQAIPGQKVEPQVQADKAAAPPAAPKQ